jgi:hypothetical protein
MVRTVSPSIFATGRIEAMEFRRRINWPALSAAGLNVARHGLDGREAERSMTCGGPSGRLTFNDNLTGARRPAAREMLLSRAKSSCDTVLILR